MPIYVTPPPPQPPFSSIDEAMEKIKADKYKADHPQTVDWLTSFSKTHD